jgi:hypothetical protein
MPALTPCRIIIGQWNRNRLKAFAANLSGKTSLISPPQRPNVSWVFFIADEKTGGNQVIPSTDSGAAKNNLLHRQSCAWEIGVHLQLNTTPLEEELHRLPLGVAESRWRK